MKTRLTKIQTIILNWLQMIAEFLKAYFCNFTEKVKTALTEKSPFLADLFWFVCTFIGTLFTQILIWTGCLMILGLTLFGISFVVVVLEASSPAVLIGLSVAIIIIALIETYNLCMKIEVENCEPIIEA